MKRILLLVAVAALFLFGSSAALAKGGKGKAPKEGEAVKQKAQKGEKHHKMTPEQLEKKIEKMEKKIEEFKADGKTEQAEKLQKKVDALKAKLEKLKDQEKGKDKDAAPAADDDEE